MIEIKATVTECIGNKWFVCVNKYVHGRGFNPVQVMQTFDSCEAGVAFAATHNPTSTVKVVRASGEPWYVADRKAGYRFHD